MIKAYEDSIDILAKKVETYKKAHAFLTEMCIKVPMITDPQEKKTYMVEIGTFMDNLGIAGEDLARQGIRVTTLQ